MPSPVSDGAGMRRIAVIGGGAAGLMAACAAAEATDGAPVSVTVFDANEKPGKKLYITGKGRCNFTNVRPVPDLFSHIVSNPRFLYSAFYRFSPEDAMAFFEESGCPVKVERGNRAFPASDRASDITRALTGRCARAGVELRLRASVRDVEAREGRVTGLLLGDGSRVPVDAAILATGGKSYPSTGSTGDGYRMAQALGHRIVPPEPSLVPLTVSEHWCGALQGLSLKNVGLTLWEEGRKKPLFEERGEMLFTHFGVSGPLVLSASAAYRRGMEARLSLDLKPALRPEQLEERLEREFASHGAKAFKNALGGLFPARLSPVMAELSGIPPMRRAAEIGREARRGFARLIKDLPLRVTGTRGFSEAVVTRGGVAVEEIDPHTMGSRLVRGLYFAGEIMDVDALTGGYNLQIAWATGRLAGASAAEQVG